MACSLYILRSYRCKTIVSKKYRVVVAAAAAAVAAVVAAAVAVVVVLANISYRPFNRSYCTRQRRDVNVRPVCHVCACSMFYQGLIAVYMEISYRH